MDEIQQKYYELIKNVRFDVYGILDKQDKILTMGTDSKLIGRVFEMKAQPVLEKLAEAFGMVLETPKQQTYYPDFIMYKDPHKRIAVDIKTAYVKQKGDMQFTLGSYASFLRNNTKNIAYPYTDFVKHYVAGFVYQRNGKAQESTAVPLDERRTMETPFYDVRCFIQEKYKIAGETTGSGNTENIGSITTKDFDDFKEGRGPFADLGEDVFEMYWSYYPKYREKPKCYANLKGFAQWLPQHIDEVKLLHPFDKDDLLQRVFNA